MRFVILSSLLFFFPFSLVIHLGDSLSSKGGGGGFIRPDYYYYDYPYILVTYIAIEIGASDSLHGTERELSRVYREKGIFLSARTQENKRK